MSFRKQSFLSIGVVSFVFLFLIKCHSGKFISSFEVIPYPSDNELTQEKIELGRKLFFDKRLSVNETVSCSSCHLPQYAFTDQKKVSEGIYKRKTERNSPSILNAAYLKTVMYDAHLPTLEMQVIVPIQEHVEMGMNMVELLKRLKSIDEYQAAAKKIFSRDFDAWVLTRSIASYERSLISKNSRFDQYYYQKKKEVLTTSEKRGWKLFSEKLYCTKCHPAPFFTTFLPENNGLYKEYTNDKGRFRIHNDSNDIGKFKIPSLRNIELTYPYMHDGSIESIELIIEHYAKGGQKHSLQNPIIQPFEITEQEKKDLKAFLFSLTDTSYLILD